MKGEGVKREEGFEDSYTYGDRCNYREGRGKEKCADAKKGRPKACPVKPCPPSLYGSQKGGSGAGRFNGYKGDFKGRTKAPWVAPKVVKEAEVEEACVGSLEMDPYYGMEGQDPDSSDKASNCPNMSDRGIAGQWANNSSEGPSWGYENWQGKGGQTRNIRTFFFLLCLSKWPT